MKKKTEIEFKPKNFIVPIEVFHKDVMFSFDESDEKVLDTLEKAKVKMSDSVKLQLVTPNYDGICILFDSGHILVRIVYGKNDVHRYSVVAHEIFHAVSLICGRLNIGLCEHTEEVYAYMIEYLTQQVYTKIL